VLCTNDSVVGVNASLPPLVITTKVATSASGTLTNIGVFTGIVDQEFDVQPTALLGQRRAEAVVTTATATASAVASVTVKSGSGGRGLPATGVEGFAPTMWVSALTLSLGGLALLFARRRRPARG
jgi:LPXTG-motif cell wall-anchored protein